MIMIDRQWSGYSIDILYDAGAEHWLHNDHVNSPFGDRRAILEASMGGGGESARSDDNSWKIFVL